jgi:hypothetical protein
MTMGLTTDTFQEQRRVEDSKKDKDAPIHSNQGVHYTHPQFQKMVKNWGSINLYLEKETVGIIPQSNHYLAN